MTDTVTKHTSPVCTKLSERESSSIETLNMHCGRIRHVTHYDDTCTILTFPGIWVILWTTTSASLRTFPSHVLLAFFVYFTRVSTIHLTAAIFRVRSTRKSVRTRRTRILPPWWKQNRARAKTTWSSAPEEASHFIMDLEETICIKSLNECFLRMSSAAEEPGRIENL